MDMAAHRPMAQPNTRIGPDCRAEPQFGILRDIAKSARLWRLIASLAWMDVRLRYRGSWLGPFWLSLSTAMMVVALGFLYPVLFHLPAQSYVPYLAVSLILWNALVQLANDAGGAFTQQEAVILSIPLPLGVHVARVVIRHLLTLAHQAAVLVPVFLLFGIQPTGQAWLLLPALTLWLLDGLVLVLLLGALGARFRDIPPIVASLLQLAFFITPVIWRAEQLGPHAFWLVANPLHAVIDVLRAPLLGHAPAPGSWPVALATSALIMAIGAIAFRHARARLAFWL